MLVYVSVCQCMLIILVYFSLFQFILSGLMVSHCQESTIEFGHALDSRFKHFAPFIWYCKKTQNCAKTIFAASSILPPPKKSIFFKEQEISQEKSLWLLKLAITRFFFIVQIYLGGQSLCSPHLTPPIQCLPEAVISSTRYADMQICKRWSYIVLRRFYL